jgi:hypothetical protein
MKERSKNLFYFAFGSFLTLGFLNFNKDNYSKKNLEDFNLLYEKEGEGYTLFLNGKESGSFSSIKGSLNLNLRGILENDTFGLVRVRDKPNCVNFLDYLEKEMIENSFIKSKDTIKSLEIIVKKHYN